MTVDKKREGRPKPLKKFFTTRENLLITVGLVVGKSTFMRRIVKFLGSKCVIVAPDSEVAALNAGGQDPSIRVSLSKNESQYPLFIEREVGMLSNKVDVSPLYEEEDQES